VVGCRGLGSKGVGPSRRATIVADYMKGEFTMKYSELPLGLKEYLVRWVAIAALGMIGHLLFTHSVDLAEIQLELRHLTKHVSELRLQLGK